VPQFMLLMKGGDWSRLEADHQEEIINASDYAEAARVGQERPCFTFGGHLEIRQPDRATELLKEDW